MTDKKWKPVEWGECADCGDAREVLTDSTKDVWVYDSDEGRCLGCGLKGSMCVADEDSVWVEWNEESP